MTTQYEMQPISTEAQPVLRQSIGFIAVGLLGSGLLYCLLQVGIAQTTFPHQANGSVITQNNQIVGSSLVAQNFQTAQYFHSRPSAINYDPMSVGGSNLAVSNPDLQVLIEERRMSFAQLNGISPSEVPLEMLAASGSGIDPDISPESAQLQAKRIAKTRHLTEQQVIDLINAQIEPKQFGVFGQARVNVLQLNLALDQL